MEVISKIYVSFANVDNAYECPALILHKQASIRPIHSASLICSARVVVDEYDGT